MAGTIMDKFLIAPINSGLRSDAVPFMLPEDAFSLLNNMYIYNGTIRQRPAAILLADNDANGFQSRLKMKIGTTSGLGDEFIVAAGFQNGTIEPGQQFSIGNDIFTIYEATGYMKTTNPATTGVYVLFLNNLAFTNATPNTDVYWYPSTRVMHLTTYNKHGDILEFAFDQEFAYKYAPTDPSGPGWLAVTGKWTSSEIIRYQSENYFGALGAPDPTIAYLFVAKYTDPVKYYDSTTDSFVDFIPNYSNVANTSIRRCKVIKQYEGRLFLMNTVEYAGTPQERVFKNRIRYSEGGNVFAVDSWYESTVAKNKGGFYDLPVNEEIMCAETLNDRLIIFCKSSIYELVPTGNPIDPFLWNLIDSNVGSKKDNVAKVNNTLMFVNNFGIYIYDGKNVTKIDQQIADDYDNYEYRRGDIYNDIDNGLIYISSNQSINSTEASRAIVYNYINNTFSIFTDNFNSLGNIVHSNVGVLYNKKFTIMGTQQGYILLLSENSVKNDISYHITNVHRVDANNINLTIYNHNLIAGRAIKIVNSALNGLNGSYIIEEDVDLNTIRVANSTVVIVDETTYTGDANVFLIDVKEIETKQFNPYMEKGYGVSINKVMFNINRTNINGKIALSTAPNGSNVETESFDFYLGDATLDTIGYNALELRQSRIWHPVYLPSTAESVALYLAPSRAILLDDEQPFQEFTINGILLYTEPAKYI